VLLQKQEIVDRLEENGDIGTARQAELVLPEQVDTDRDQQLLTELGVNIKYLLNQNEQ
jgi:hypothetical protein